MKQKKIDTSVIPAPFTGLDNEQCRKCGLNGLRDIKESNPVKYVFLVDSKDFYPYKEWGQILREVGLKKADVRILPVVRCTPRKEPKMGQIKACRGYLLHELDRLSPRFIMGFGSAALRAITNSGSRKQIIGARGKNLVMPGLENTDTWENLQEKPVIRVTYSLAGTLQAAGVHLRQYIVDDLVRIHSMRLPYPPKWRPQSRGIAVDTEFAPDGTLLTVAVADSETAVSFEPGEPEFKDTSYDITKASILAGHSVTADLDQLITLGQCKPEWVEGKHLADSLLLARLVDENRGKGAYGLEHLMTSYFNVHPWKAQTEAIGVDATQWPVELRKERCRLDAWASAMLVKRLYKEVPAKLRTFTHQVATAIHRIWLAGAAVDLAYFEKMGSELKAQMGKAGDILEKRASQLGMSEFVPTKDAHVRELLYERLKLPVNKRTPSGLPAVDKTTVSQLKCQDDTLKLLLEFNKAEKLYSTWHGSDGKKTGTPLCDLIKPAYTVDGIQYGYLPFHINPLGARTGRRSSTAPNSQNWPKDVKKIVVSRWPGGKILSVDYKSLEIVLIAWLAKEPKLARYFSEGKGYIGIGEELFGKSVEKGSPEYRVVKSIVLGTNYNMGPRKLASQLWDVLGVKLGKTEEKHYERVVKIRKRYLGMFPRLSRYMLARKNELLETQQVVNMVGQVRHLPCPGGEDLKGFKRLWNQAINFPVQGLAGAVTGAALVDLEEAFCDWFDMSRLDYHKCLMEDRDRMLRGQPPELRMPVIINEVHDDLVFDLTPEHANEKMIADITGIMCQVPTLRKLVPQFDIPLKVDVELGDRWGEENG